MFHAKRNEPGPLDSCSLDSIGVDNVRTYAPGSAGTILLGPQKIAAPTVASPEAVGSTNLIGSQTTWNPGNNHPFNNASHCMQCAKQAMLIRAYVPPDRFFERPPNPNKLSIDVNVYLTEVEIKSVCSICSDFYTSQERNVDIADQVRRIVGNRNKQIKWFVACGSMAVAQLFRGRDAILLAKYGDIYLAVLKGHYINGRVA